MIAGVFADENTDHFGPEEVEMATADADSRDSMTCGIEDDFT